MLKILTNFVWSIVLLLGFTFGIGVGVAEADEVPAPQADEPVIEQPVARREVAPPVIDAEDFELSAYAGLLSVEDFGTEPVYGLRLAYQITEDVFVEGSAGFSTVSDSSFRRIGLPLFDSEEQDLSYYQLSVGYNLLPGEVFPAPRRAWASAMYVVGGVGSAELAGEDEFTFNLGLGLRMLPWERVAVRVEMRDLMFDSDLVGESELKHNLELTAGVGFYF